MNLLNTSTYIYCIDTCRSETASETKTKLYFISECDDGEYIKNKICVLCQGHCRGGAHCNKLTGRCDQGCENQWTGDFCHGK